jgi:hypothetical protein
MMWRNFNGQSIQEPIKFSVEKIIIREHELGNKLKSLHRNRLTSKRKLY